MFYLFTSNDNGVGRLQGPITFEVCTTILYYLATHTSTQTFRRCPICLCCLPKFDVRSSRTLSRHRVWSVDPYGLSACGAWPWKYCEISSFRIQVGDAMLIALVALYSPLKRLAPVRSMLYIRLQASLTHIQAPASPNPLWEASTNSICQLFIILMANIFLARRSVYILV